MRRAIAWCCLVGGFLATVPLLYLAAFYGWAAGGPPQAPERRQMLLAWCFTCLASALAAPIVGILVFRSLRRSKAAQQAHQPPAPSGRRLMGKDVGQIVREYVEEDELDRYVWKHFLDLFTDFEQRVGRAANAEQKAQDRSGPKARILRERWGAGSAPDVGAALAGGWPRFRSEARARVLREHASGVFVNRCERCFRVVETPKALQCLWCGHDWHR